MKKIWNLMEDEPNFPLLENTQYQIINPEDSSCDVMICALEHVEYAGAFANPEESFFIVALNDPSNESHLVPGTFNAWIDKKQLHRLPQMLDEYKSHIDEKVKAKNLHVMIEKFIVSNSVHHANLEEIKKNMRESTSEIEQIFEARVEEMKLIYKDSLLVFEHLSKLKEEIDPEIFKNLEEPWSKTESILNRTNEVIKAMFGFVSVLQCEDRITQMIDGIQNIMIDDIANATELGCTVSTDKETALKEKLVAFYTIQEQRDYAMGIDNAMKGCKLKVVDIDDFLLF